MSIMKFLSIFILSSKSIWLIWCKILFVYKVLHLIYKLVQSKFHPAWVTNNIFNNSTDYK